MPKRPSDETEGAADHGEEDALRHELTNDPASVGAHRGANGHLALADGRADEEQVRDVGARDQQHAGDGGEQDRSSDFELRTKTF